MRINVEFDPTTSGLVASRKGRSAVISPELLQRYEALKQSTLNGKRYAIEELSGTEQVKNAVAIAGKLNGLAKLDGMRVGRKAWNNDKGFVNALELFYLPRV